MSQSPRDPLGPISFIVSLLGTLMIAFTVVFVPLTVFGSGTLFGFGDPDVCAVNEAVAWDLEDAESYLGKLPPRTFVGPDAVRICQAAAPQSAQLMESAVILTPFLFVAGFLLLTRRSLNAARKGGLFSDAVARRVTGIGWYLLLGSLLTGVMTGLLRYWLLAHLIPEQPPSWERHISVSVPVLIAGFCVLSVGRVLAHAVRIQREVDTLV